MWLISSKSIYKIHYDAVQVTVQNGWINLDLYNWTAWDVMLIALLTNVNFQLLSHWKWLSGQIARLLLQQSKSEFYSNLSFLIQNITWKDGNKAKEAGVGYI